MDLRAIGLGLAFVIMWSSAFTSARIIVAEAPPLSALALRFLISGVIGVVIARLMGQTWHLTRAQWKSVVIFGICQNALYLGLNFVAMQWIEASLASIIASTMPLIVAVQELSDENQVLTDRVTDLEDKLAQLEQKTNQLMVLLQDQKLVK